MKSLSVAILLLAMAARLPAAEIIGLNDGTRIVADKVTKHDGFLRVSQKTMPTRNFHAPRPTNEPPKDEYRTTDIYWDRLDDATLKRFFPGRWEQLQVQKYKAIKKDDPKITAPAPTTAVSPDPSTTARILALRSDASALLKETILKKEMVFSDSASAVVVAAGEKVTVKSIEADTLVVALGQRTQRVPILDTDFAERQRRSQQLLSEADRLIELQANRERAKEFLEAEQAAYRRALESRAIVNGLLVDRKKTGGATYNALLTAKNVLIPKAATVGVDKIRGATVRLYQDNMLTKDEVFLVDYFPDEEIGSDIKFIALEEGRTSTGKRILRVIWPFSLEQWRAAKAKAETR